jgi:heptosyltransferase III
MRRLLIRPGAIGDFIVSLPALASLTTDSTEIWTPSRTLPLIAPAGIAARTRSIAATGLDLLGIADPPPATLIEALRRFDSIVSWYGTNRPEFRDTVAALDLPFTFFRALPPEGAPLHAVDFYLEQVRELAVRAVDPLPRIACPAGPGGYAVIHPFSGSPRKNWPLERFRALAARLERVMPVHWCRGDEDPPLSGATQFEDLYDLACWIARARLYIGNDSGITHLAAATGVPTLALFGPTDPAVWGPRGPHVRIARFGPGAARSI